MELLPSAGDIGTLEDFLKTLEGKTIKEVLDSVSYMSLYNMNKHGIGGARGSDKDGMDFANALQNFVNRDVMKHKPREREYDTEEFKAENDYEGYSKARSQKARVSMARNKVKRDALRDGDDKTEEINKLEDEIAKLQDFIDDHQYLRGYLMIDAEYDKAVKDYHNMPLKADYLKDDGSEAYDRLLKAFRAIGGDDEGTIDI
tara:strand:- start:52 stop:657 length:606 start_codon:yes stop_codon:yes gene_type:complete